MEESINIVSEEYRKYLIEVIYEERCYFTVWGTDLPGGNADKWLVDQTDWLLFKGKISLMK